jgi:hypothetical protein
MIAKTGVRDKGYELFFSFLGEVRLNPPVPAPDEDDDDDDDERGAVGGMTICRVNRSTQR